MTESDIYNWIFNYRKMKRKVEEKAEEAARLALKPAILGIEAIYNGRKYFEEKKEEKVEITETIEESDYDNSCCTY